MHNNERLTNLGLVITGLEPEYTVTHELVWIEVRTAGNPGHVKVTEEWDALVVGWYADDDAEMDGIWDCETFADVLAALDTLFE